jgi:hypothetical protein
MMRKILLNTEKDIENPVQRNSLFRTTCKTKDRVCKVIVDSGSTNNLVSTKMVEEARIGDWCTSEPIQSLVVTNWTSGSCH